MGGEEIDRRKEDKYSRQGEGEEYKWECVRPHRPDGGRQREVIRLRRAPLLQLSVHETGGFGKRRQYLDLGCLTLVKSGSEVRTEQREVHRGSPKREESLGALRSRINCPRRESGGWREASLESRGADRCPRGRPRGGTVRVLGSSCE